MIRRGDVVIVQIPFTDVAGAKKRPALVVQNDAYNQTIRKTLWPFSPVICVAEVTPVTSTSIRRLQRAPPQG
jgi:mRNA-degrading endonuclease toxin of MazEF toxin-antitoxin module